MASALLQLEYTLANFRLPQAVLAEGVESVEQLEILRQLGAEYVQGYLLGKPQPVDFVEREWLLREVLDGEQDSCG